MAKKTALSRRDFLQAGGFAFLVPFLPSMLYSKQAQAASPGTKRCLIFHTPDGTFPNFWRPLNSPTYGTVGNDAPLKFNRMHASPSLQKYADNILMVDGLSFPTPGGNHAGGITEALTCGLPDSVDLPLAKALSSNAPYQSLHLAAKCDPGKSVVRRSGQAAAINNNPIDFFSKFISKQGGTGENTSKVDLAILDLSKQQIEYLKKQLGKIEKDKLEAHLQAISEAQKRLTNANGLAACKDLKAPTTPLDPAAKNIIGATGQLQMDNALLSLSCGLTQVVSLQWSCEADDQIVIYDADPSIAGSDSFHARLSHNRTDDQLLEKLILTEVWFTNQFAYLIDKLATTDDPANAGRKLLDTTAVVWTRALGDGTMHTQNSVSYMIAAGKDLNFKTQPGGRFYSYPGREQGFGNRGAAPGLSVSGDGWKAVVGPPHLRLMHTIAKGLGVEIPTFSKPGTDSKVLAELLK